LIIGNEGNEFIVSDGKGVYKTGKQIITSKVSTVVGSVAKTEIKSISFDDEEAMGKARAERIAPLEELQQAYPGAARLLESRAGIILRPSLLDLGVR
jgi:inner membrane protein